MIRQKFSSLFDFAKKSRTRAGDGRNEGNFQFFTSSSIITKRIDRAQYFDEALIFGTGGNASIHYSHEPFSTSTDCIVAIAQHENINIKFVYYYLHGNIHLIERGFKGAGLKHISKSYIENLDIPVLSIETQNKIVAVLDKASLLNDKRKHSLVLLEEFMKSSFWNLFGDLGVNNKKWKSSQLSNLCRKKDDIRCGPFGTHLRKSEFKSKGVAIWGIKHINKKFKTKPDEYVTDTKAKQLSNYLIKPNDIVMTRKGSIGNCELYPEDFEIGIMHSDVLRIRVNEEIINPYFLLYQFKYNEVLQWNISRISPGVVMAGINVAKLKKIEVLVPDKMLQDKFEALCKKVNAIKEKASFERQNELFLSLLQKAFNGQLNFNVDFELDALLNEIDLGKGNNDVSKISRDISYLQRLIDKLNLQDFQEKDMYDRAKHVIFQLLNEKNSRVAQEFVDISRSLKLTLK